MVSAGPRKKFKFFRTRVWGKSWVSILDTVNEQRRKKNRKEKRKVRRSRKSTYNPHYFLKFVNRRKTDRVCIVRGGSVQVSKTLGLSVL